MDIIEHTEVDSTTIRSVNYNKKTKILIVEFKNGGKYEYTDVPTEVFDSFVSAQSWGSHFHKNIKGKYNSTKL